MRKRRFELLWYYYRQPLKLVRLPVPPLPRGRALGGCPSHRTVRLKPDTTYYFGVVGAGVAGDGVTGAGLVAAGGGGAGVPLTTEPDMSR